MRPAALLNPDSEQNEELVSIDGFLYTPSGSTVLRGPVRPANAGLGRRGMGQAQRRAVTAPSAVSESTSATGRRRDFQSTLTEQNEEEEVEAPRDTPIEVPALLSTTPRSTPIKRSNPSPLMPVMSQSTNTATRTEALDLRETTIPDLPESLARAMDSPVPVHIAAAVPLPIDQEEVDVADSASLKKEDPEVALSLPIDVREIGSVSTGPDDYFQLGHEPIASTPPIELPAADETKEDLEDVTVRLETALQHDDTPKVGIATDITENIAATAHTAQIILVPLPMASVPAASTPTAPAVAAPAPMPVDKPATEPTTASAKAPTARAEPLAKALVPAPPRKPPVPTAASARPRPVASAIERKPFRPMTAAQAAKSPVKALLVKSEEKRPEPAAAKPREEVKRPESAATTISKSSISASAPNAAASALAENAAARPAPSRAASKPSTLTAPTKASAQRAGAAAPQTSSQTSKPATVVAAALSALPPVRKEKVRLKAALPSFRPVRQNALAPTKAGNDKQAASLASSKSSSTGMVSAKPPVVVGMKKGIARVKPESIPLPDSPIKMAEFKAAEVPLPPSPLRQLSGVAKVRPEAIPLPTSPVIPQLSQLAGEPQLIALPPSPLSATSTLPSQKSTSSYSERQPFKPKLVEVLGETHSSRSVRSKASTTALTSDSASEEDVDTTQGVAFKTSTGKSSSEPTRTGQTPKVYSEPVRAQTPKLSSDPTRSVQRPKVLMKDHWDAPDLIQFSSPAPNRFGTPVKMLGLGMGMGMGKDSPRMTPGRKALEMRDANVRLVELD